MKNHLIQVGFFGNDSDDKTKIINNISEGKQKYVINKYDKIFNIHLCDMKTVNSNLTDVHCICLLFRDEKGFEYIAESYEKLNQTINLRNAATNCIFMLVSMRCDDETPPFNDKVQAFATKKHILYTSVTLDDFSRFRLMYDQVLKMNFLENISLYPTICSVA